MKFFRKRNINEDYKNLISVLEVGGNENVRKVLFGNKKEVPDYLPITYTTLSRLEKPASASEGLSVFEKHQNGKYDLLIIKRKWSNEKVPFSPLIVDRNLCKIVGNMLPYNELHDLLTKREASAISELGVIWVKFTFQFHFPTKKSE